jgi:nucleoside-diphosphate-sugar epimerase
MKIFVTGASGFIGSSFVNTALKRGHDVLGLYRQPHTVPSSLNLKCVTGSLKNPNWTVIAKFQPDVCVHAAGAVAPEYGLNDGIHETLLIESKWFLTELRNACNPSVLGIGSCAEYKESGYAQREDAVIEPSTRYGRTKALLRKWGEDHSITQGYLFCWARVFYAYGPGEHPERLCSMVIRKLLQKQDVVIKTPSIKKDFIFIDDVAQALCLLSELNVGGIVNVGTGDASSIAEMASTIATLLNESQSLKFCQNNESDLVGDMIADVKRLHSFGFTPKWSKEHALAKLIDFVKDKNSTKM